MQKEIQIKSDHFYDKIQRIVKVLNTDPDYSDLLALVVNLGLVKNDETQPKTCLFHLWLLAFEFSETIIGLTRKKLIVLTSNRKKQILDKMEIPESYKGPRIEVILRDPNSKEVEIAEQNYQQFCKALFPNTEEISGQIAQFSDEEIHGKFCNDFQSFFKKTLKGAKFINGNPFFKNVTSVKTSDDINASRIASRFSQFAFKELISRIENIIDVQKTERHDQIARKIEGILDNNDKMQNFCSKNPNRNIDTGYLEFGYPIMVQSGGTYNLKMGAQCQKTLLQPDTIILSVCGKYKDFCANLSRTLIIGPIEEQKVGYEYLLKIFEELVDNLKIGLQICEVYNIIQKKSKEINPALKEFLCKTLGYGIGLQPKEELLAVNDKNQKVIEAGMIFNIRLSLANFDSQKRPTKNCLQIADTVLILAEGPPEVLTRQISKIYNDISYTLDDEEEDIIEGEDTGTAPRRSKKDKKHRDPESDHEGVVLPTRTRVLNPVAQNDDERKQHQEKLFETKYDDFKKKYEDDEIKLGDNLNNKQIKVDKCLSYASRKEFPYKEMKQDMAYYDHKNHTLLVPMLINNIQYYVPFHLHTIKNASLNIEKSTAYLRVNFHTPISYGKDIVVPNIDNIRQSIFVKEITLKSETGGHNLQDINKAIKDDLKHLKTMQSMKEKNPDTKDSDLHLAQETLIMFKSGKKVVLDCLTIRPNIGGKKVLGLLETNKNGFRFISNKGIKVDFTYANIRNAFFQPCDDDLIVLVHFRLKAPIMIGTKKLLDVQFYQEVGNQYDDLNDQRNARRMMNDFDELEQERKERSLKKRLNDRFKHFCKEAEKFIGDVNPKNKLEFDIPYPELKFVGCHAKSSVNLYPTANCLVSLMELPTFVMDIEDIEIVHFERVTLSIKNFDVVFVYKDFTTYKRINSIPMESLDTLKSWIDQCEIVYSEGPMPLNWVAVLSQIREDVPGFISEGGWSFLHESKGGEEAEEESQDSDSNFEEAEKAGSAEEHDEDKDSDFSEEDESDAQSSSVNSSQSDELSDKGTTYEEMERQEKRRQQEKMGNIRSMKSNGGGMNRSPTRNGNQIQRPNGNYGARNHQSHGVSIKSIPQKSKYGQGNNYNNSASFRNNVAASSGGFRRR